MIAKYLTPAVVRACREMAEAEAREEYEDAEIVGSGIEYWLGLRRVSASTIKKMLMLCLVSSEGIGTNYERFTLNEDGHGVAKDPENYIPRIMRNDQF